MLDSDSVNHRVKTRSELTGFNRINRTSPLVSYKSQLDTFVHSPPPFPVAMFRCFVPCVHQV